MNNELEDISEASALLRILEIGKQEFAAGEYQLASEYFAEQKRLRTHGANSNSPRPAPDAGQ